ncbi:MAG: MgtC/SapB family protein [Candidatus Roizmanbacteria bacterium]
MNDIDLISKFALAITLASVIGLERQFNENNETSNKSDDHVVLGIRTAVISSIIGCFAGLLGIQNPLIFGVISVAYILLLISNYIIGCLKTKDIGITTELALVYCYMLGFIIAIGSIPGNIIIAVTVVVMLFLSQKQKIHNYLSFMKKSELHAFIMYGLVALVVLPFLPNFGYTFHDIPWIDSVIEALGWNSSKLLYIELINPFKLWFIVALITGIDIAGYILERTVGANKGILLASITGGLISSTATTQSLAQQSIKNSNTNLLVSSAIFANLASYIPLIIIIAPVNSTFLGNILPIMILIMSTFLVIGLYFFIISKKFIQKSQNKSNINNVTEVFALGPALKFAGIFLVIRIISKLALLFFGSTGFLVASGFSAVTGVDAPIINIAELAMKQITVDTAIFAFLMVNTVNLIAKSIYSFIQGKKEFAIKFSLSMIITIVLSFLTLLFI